jgi:hypothetical protein
MYNAQEIQIGADVVTSVKVAMKGVISDDMRPHAMTKPHPKPRFSVFRAKGVNLRNRVSDDTYVSSDVMHDCTHAYTIP